MSSAKLFAGNFGDAIRIEPRDTTAAATGANLLTGRYFKLLCPRGLAIRAPEGDALPRYGRPASAFRPRAPPPRGRPRAWLDFTTLAPVRRLIDIPRSNVHHVRPAGCHRVRITMFLPGTSAAAGRWNRNASMTPMMAADARGAA